MIRRSERSRFFSSPVTKLSFGSFFTVLGVSAMDSVWALYLDGFFANEAMIGFFSAFLTLVAFFAYFVFIPVIEKYDKAKIYFLSLAMFSVIYLSFVYIRNVWMLLLVTTIASILLTLRVTSYGILIRDSSSRSNLSKSEGVAFTFANSAWVIGPLVGGFILAKFSILYVFVFTSFFTLISLAWFKTFKVSDIQGKKKVDGNFFKNFKSFFSSKDRIIAYTIAGGSNSWWTLIYLFIPIYIIRNGLNPIWVGYFLFAIALPLILTEYHFAKVASQKGFRKVFQLGFIIPVVLSFVMFFVSGNVFVVLGLLVLCSFGLAMLEPTAEAYFFDILKGKEAYRYYGPFNTSLNLFSFISRMGAGFVLLFLPFKFLFLFFGILMFCLFLVSSKAKNVRESRRKD